MEQDMSQLHCKRCVIDVVYISINWRKQIYLINKNFEWFHSCNSRFRAKNNQISSQIFRAVNEKKIRGVKTLQTRCFFVMLIGSNSRVSSLNGSESNLSRWEILLLMSSDTDKIRLTLTAQPRRQNLATGLVFPIKSFEFPSFSFFSPSFYVSLVFSIILPFQYFLTN